ncbi:hypothetical protein EDC01DRAFT_482956 [Geopyxis carbonaria]|nr:hypothetical protein EDC01DRAFT_482956 [Geopyxis carbonaria]
MDMSCAWPILLGTTQALHLGGYATPEIHPLRPYPLPFTLPTSRFILPSLRRSHLPALATREPTCCDTSLASGWVQIKHPLRPALAAAVSCHLGGPLHPSTGEARASGGLTKQHAGVLDGREWRVAGAEGGGVVVR